MAENFHIVGRTADIRDVQRTYNWQVQIPAPTAIAGAWPADDLLLRARSAAIPGITINTIESSFMGMKQHFAGNATLEHTLAIEFEEFEDQKVLSYLNEWTKAMFDTQTATDGGGAITAAEKKSDYAVDVTLDLYANNKEKLDKKITFHGCWLQNIGSVALAYGDAASVKYACTFQWDYYTLDKA